jgi:ATP-dependent Clp protease ATP-binding subunit ClpC
MYERFTDTAREAMKAAASEARRFRHEYIGTEHLLLALAKGDGGAATELLEGLGIEPSRIQDDLRNILVPGPAAASMRGGFLHRWWQRNWLPQTARAKKVVEFALEEARAVHASYIGTGHLLLGLVREHEGVAAQVLATHGVRLDDLRQELARQLQRVRED